MFGHTRAVLTPPVPTVDQFVDGGELAVLFDPPQAKTRAGHRSLEEATMAAACSKCSGLGPYMFVDPSETAAG